MNRLPQHPSSVFLHWQLSCLLLLCLPTSALQAQTPPDVFDELQYNTWYLPTEDHQAKLYITSIGQKGDTIVCLHGGPGNDFQYLVPALRSLRKEYRFILFDQRGSLLSPVADSLVSSLSMDVLVNDLETLRKSLKQDQMILFAHSFGTFLALSYFIKYPEHVRAMILTASLPPYTTQQHTLTKVAQEMNQQQRILRQRPEIQEILRAEKLIASGDVQLTAPQASAFYKLDGLASFNIYQVHKWKQLIGGRVYFNSKVAAAIGGTMPDLYDIRPNLKKNPIPVFVLQGDHDYLDPTGSYWRALSASFSSIHVSVLPKAGHYSWIDAPALFHQKLREALNKATRAR